MRLISLIFLLGIMNANFLFAQNELHSPQNIKLFANYLFYEKDYLRAAEEYQRLDHTMLNDTLIYKTGLSYSIIHDFDKANEILKKVEANSALYGESILELLKIQFLQNEKLNPLIIDNSTSTFETEKYHSGLLKLLSITNLRYELPLINCAESTFLSLFEESMKSDAKELLDLKISPPHKNPITAGILSAIIPGSGKFYTGEIGDGIIALLTTGIFGFLSYDNFIANHNFRGWLFAGVSTLFYAGNIYGSVASAQIYNSRVDYEFTVKLNSFLEENNFFIPQVTFFK